jgi:membrane peptidoglycan carboxypeptidase
VASRGAHKTFTLLKLIGLLAVTGVLAAGFLLPYVIGAGLATRNEADRFLNTQCDLQETPVQQKTTIYASDGKTVLAKLFDQNRQVIPLRSIPVSVRQALIDTEDKRFYSHHGVDVRGMMRALLSESDGTTQGASTLTQQYVKQVRFYQATTDAERQEAIKQDLDRKIYEAKCALMLEKKYTKPQILEKYLNIAYFGEHSYGIAVAAKTYFNKTPRQLTVPEAAVLAGLVKNPTLYDPFQRQNLKVARQRRDDVIDNMAAVGDITTAQATRYKAAPIRLATKVSHSDLQGCIYYDKNVLNGGYFCDYVIDWLESHGFTEAALKTGGLNIVSSLNAQLQNYGQRAIWKKYSASAAATIISPSIDPRNGQVLTMLTSKYYDYGLRHLKSKDKRYTVAPIFTNATAGAGSTYKYFSLLAALTAGVKPTQTFTTSGKYYPKNCPQNNDGTRDAYTMNAGNYPATMTLDAATYESSNTFFVGLEDQLFDCDLSTIVKMAQNLGVDSLNGPYYDPDTAKKNGLSIAKTVVQEHLFNFTLGQTGSSPLQLSSAYGATANDGVLCPPNPVISITDPRGRKVKFNHPTCSRKIDPWVARTALQILSKDTTNGTAAGTFSSFYATHGRFTYPVAAKTGTNNAAYYNKFKRRYEDNGKNSAIWFVGLTPRLVSATTMYDPAHTSRTLNIKGVYNSGTDVFGAYAGTYWIAAYGKYVTAHGWSWPSPDGVPDGVSVPSVVGRTEADAVQVLKDAHFKPKRYPIACGSNLLVGQVAYSGPGVAAPGSTVYYCMSNGKRLSIPPKRIIPKKRGGGTGGNGHGNGNPGGRRHRIWQGADGILAPSVQLAPSRAISPAVA